MSRFAIQKKLMITLVPVVLAAFLFFLLTVYWVSFRETQNIVNRQADTNVNQKVQLVDSYLQKLRQETEIFMFDTNLQSRMQISQARLNDEAKEDLETEFRRDMYSMIISYDIYVERLSMGITMFGRWTAASLTGRSLPAWTAMRRLPAV